MVILAVIVSNVICMVFILESSKKQITDEHKAYHGRCYQYNIKNCGEWVSNADTEDLDYDEYAKSLSDVKLEGMDSSYVYVVKNDGTMLIIQQRKRLDSLLRMP